MRECEIRKEKRHVLEKMMTLTECDMENGGTPDSSEKTIAILVVGGGHRGRNRKGTLLGKHLCNIGKQRSERPKCWRCLY